ncbi:hypothetical protein JZK55_17090 [Dissulfurispira thermophila]|uniref:Uncharacterized protein n=2 Tax=root TaxID=1 RepID=A0A7G1H4Z5_9BACT|nr:hypothetical protein [Dissulfurispira thermophila]BCB96787.1 hypothetical protein JZK55_17090 [Dissulfurispira thermophila]
MIKIEVDDRKFKRQGKDVNMRDVCTEGEWINGELYCLYFDSGFIRCSDVIECPAGYDDECDDYECDDDE